MGIGLAIVLTAIVVLVIQNLTSGEKKIEHEIHAEYGVDSPQFRRTMGALLGPALVDGNAVTSLQNGDEIFPAMLEAIRSAETDSDIMALIRTRSSASSAFTARLLLPTVDSLSNRIRSDSIWRVRINAIMSLSVSAYGPSA